MPNNFLNFKNSLNNPKNSFIKNFILELQEHFAKLQSSLLLNSLPKHTILTFAKFDSNFAVCFDYNKKSIYYLPQKNIIGPKPKPGEALKWHSPGKFYVDYTAILAEESELNNYLKNCKIAK